MTSKFREIGHDPRYPTTYGSTFVETVRFCDATGDRIDFDRYADGGMIVSAKKLTDPDPAETMIVLDTNQVAQLAALLLSTLTDGYFVAITPKLVAMPDDDPAGATVIPAHKPPSDERRTGSRSINLSGRWT